MCLSDSVKFVTFLLFTQNDDNRWKYCDAPKVLGLLLKLAQQYNQIYV